MRNRKTIMGAVMLASVMAIGLPMISTVAHAQEEEGSGRKTRQVQSVTPAVYNKITDAQNFLEMEDTANALATMKELESKADKYKSYDRVQIFQMLGYIYAQEDQYPQAISYFEKMTSEEDCPPELRNQTLYTMAQLYMATEDYNKAISTLQNWFKVAENPSPSAYMLLASAYMAQDNFKAAKEPAETGLKLGEEQYQRMVAARNSDPEAPEPEPVRENWYVIVLSTALQTQDYQRARELIDVLLQKFPKRDYWLYLSSVSSELGKEMDQLGAMEAAYRQDLLIRDTELTNLAQLYMYHNIPIKGAWVIDDALKDGKIKKDDAKAWETLANAYYNAQEMEKSIEPLTKAAELSDDGKLYVRLGQSYMDLAKWKEAASAFQAARKKGGLTNEGEAALYLGMSYFNANEFDDAREAFREARDHEQTKQSAAQWLTYLQSEEERQALLK